MYYYSNDFKSMYYVLCIVIRKEYSKALWLNLGLTWAL